MQRSDPPLPQQRIAGPAEAERFFEPLLDHAHETAAFVYLDGAQGVLGMRQLHSELTGYLDLPIRTIAADALALDAQAVVMAHNHPSGDPTPSSADREATRRLARALDGIGIRLIDHLVMTRNGVTSFRALGWL
ncbi:JAB domain-containing protein [Sphingomonas soli]|uniref:JAB domain-containing protein n=1 Tax=Sphingomonas soli TaxID=266127 RepID=UPI00082B19BC|nr:JAB domain-containing protein [Sphingomonas soli]